MMGRIRAHLLADLVAVSGDPTEKIAAARQEIYQSEGITVARRLDAVC